MKPIRIAVIGCGTAGPAAAILLAEQGHQVTLFERAAEIQPVGAGLLLQPDGQDVLARMGLLESIAKHSARVDVLLGHNTRGRRVLDLSYAGLGDVTGLGVHRALLIDIMLGRVAETDGCELVCGSHVEKIHQEEASYYLHEKDGDRTGPFELVILADGARSSLREAVGLVKSAKEYPWGALWAIVPDTEQVYPHTLRQFYEGVGTFLGFLPTGFRQETGEPLVSVFWSLRNSSAADLMSAPHGDLIERMRAMAPEADSILAHCQSWGDWVHARYMDVTLKQAHTGGVVCIGDAAHAMSPQLGQGVTMALRDAWLLAEAMKKQKSVDAALAAYWSVRRDATRFYQFANRAATGFFQGDCRLLGVIRDAFFGPMNDLPIYRGQMQRTLAGYKRGFLSSEMPRPLLPSGEAQG